MSANEIHGNSFVLRPSSFVIFMSPHPQLSLRPQQRLVITPALRQSLFMLQVPVLELQTLVQHELVENPLLQEMPDTVEEGAGEDAGTEFETLGESQTTNRTTELTPADPPPSEGLSLQDWEDYFSSETSDLGYMPRRGTEEENGETRESNSQRPQTLSEFLAEQLQVAQTDEALVGAAEIIIGNLDHRGFLVLPIQELAEAEQIEPSLLERALVLVQGFEPAGIAARNLQECLLIQLQQKRLHGSLAHRMVLEAWEDLEHRRFGAIAKKLSAPAEDIHMAMEVIIQLNPRPARNFSGDPAQTLVPDIMVDEVEGRYVIRINDDGLPRLGVNRKYVELLRKQADSSDAKRFIEEKLQSAVWLVRGIEQRKRSMYKVAEAIVVNQQEYFQKGIEFLKPMTLQDIATLVGLHESTISRVTMSKYMQTPRGILPMKFFFTHAFTRTDGGAETSATSVKELLRELCVEELKHHPFSDQQLVQKLSEQGLRVARRTVAKYREEMGIPSASMRKKSSV